MKTNLKWRLMAIIPFCNFCGPEKGRFVDSVLCELILEVPTVSFHTGSESNTPLLNCCIDDVLTEQAPLLHQTHLHNAERHVSGYDRLALGVRTKLNTVNC